MWSNGKFIQCGVSENFLYPKSFTNLPFGFLATIYFKGMTVSMRKYEPPLSYLVVKYCTYVQFLPNTRMMSIADKKTIKFIFAALFVFYNSFDGCSKITALTVFCNSKKKN